VIVKQIRIGNRCLLSEGVTLGLMWSEERARHEVDVFSLVPLGERVTLTLSNDEKVELLFNVGCLLQSALDDCEFTMPILNNVRVSPACDVNAYFTCDEAARLCGFNVSYFIPGPEWETGNAERSLE